MSDTFDSLKVFIFSIKDLIDLNDFIELFTWNNYILYDILYIDLKEILYNVSLLNYYAGLTIINIITLHHAASIRFIRKKSHYTVDS